MRLRPILPDNTGDLAHAISHLYRIPELNPYPVTSADLGACSRRTGQALFQAQPDGPERGRCPHAQLNPPYRFRPTASPIPLWSPPPLRLDANMWRPCARRLAPAIQRSGAPTPFCTAPSAFLTRPRACGECRLSRDLHLSKLSNARTEALTHTKSVVNECLNIRPQLEIVWIRVPCSIRTSGTGRQGLLTAKAH